MGPPINSSLPAWRDETIALLKNSSDSPWLDAELLIEHVTGASRTRQHQEPNGSLSSDNVLQLNVLRQRRIDGVPLAYILETAHFWTLELNVSPAVLIPRPETELLVERALQVLTLEPSTALDLGTGSGAIALAIASERPGCTVLACDVSESALIVARTNQQKLQLRNVELRHSNWFRAIGDQRFDVIVSNPPYIGKDDPYVQSDVRAYEPHLALFADDDGMQALQLIIQQASGYLKQHGWLLLEHGWQQAEKVQDLLESRGFDSVASHADLAGHLRVTEARFSSP